MMNLKYDIGEGGTLHDVRFCSSLTGCEYVTSTKEALGLLKITNPARDFTEAAKAGEFDTMSDEEYKAILDTIACVSYLWRYPEDWRYPEEKTPDGKSAQPELNPLMLLANAIMLIASLRTELRNANLCDLEPF